MYEAPSRAEGHASTGTVSLEGAARPSDSMIGVRAPMSCPGIDADTIDVGRAEDSFPFNASRPVLSSGHRDSTTAGTSSMDDRLLAGTVR